MRIRGAAAACGMVAWLFSSSCQQILGIEIGMPEVPVLSVATKSVSFGFVDCGETAPTTKTIAVNNTGSTTLTVTTALGAHSVFAIVDGATLSVLPGASGTITISATLPQATVAGSTTTETLTLTTNDPTASTIEIPLQGVPALFVPSSMMSDAW